MAAHMSAAIGGEASRCCEWQGSSPGSGSLLERDRAAPGAYAAPSRCTPQSPAAKPAPATGLVPSPSCLCSVVISGRNTLVWSGAPCSDSELRLSSSTRVPPASLVPVRGEKSLPCLRSAVISGWATSVRGGAPCLGSELRLSSPTRGLPSAPGAVLSPGPCAHLLLDSSYCAGGAAAHPASPKWGEFICISSVASVDPE
mmetsp:Transcript_76109/g.215232  ORF Transcript_76109/g.215232 Transcript_76109/m.215232 type:complete len:200 (+) Transcript_76109:352-951(+)